MPELQRIRSIRKRSLTDNDVSHAYISEAQSFLTEARFTRRFSRSSSAISVISTRAPGSSLRRRLSRLGIRDTWIQDVRNKFGTSTAGEWNRERKGRQPWIGTARYDDFIRDVPCYMLPPIKDEYLMSGAIPDDDELDGIETTPTRTALACA